MAKLYQTDGGRQSSGFILERRDCTVRSFACAADIPYVEAHSIMKRAGRRNGHGYYPERGLEVAKNDGLLDYTKVPCSIPAGGYRVTWPTLAQVLAKYKTGRYIICTGRHAMALIDGVIHDTGLVGMRSRVVNIFELKMKVDVPKQIPEPIITQAQINELWARMDRLQAHRDAQVAY